MLPPLSSLEPPGAQVNIVDRLLGADANPNGGPGIPPLFRAMRHGSTKLVARLLDAGASTAERSPDSPQGHMVAALLFAMYIEFTPVEIVQQLLKAGADIGELMHGEQGLTVLHHNVVHENARMDVLIALLKAAPRQVINQRSHKEHQTPLHVLSLTESRTRAAACSTLPARADRRIDRSPRRSQVQERGAR